MCKSKLMPGQIINIIVICLLLIGCAANSQTLSQNHTISATTDIDSSSRAEAAEELLKTLKMEMLLQKTIEQMLDVQLQQNPAIKPYKHVMLQFMNKYMGYNSLKNDLIKIYADAFNENELNELKIFYETPVGQKALEKVPELSAKGAMIGHARLQKHKGELEEMIKKESERIEQLQNQ